MPTQQEAQLAPTALAVKQLLARMTVSEPLRVLEVELQRRDRLQVVVVENVGLRAGDGLQVC